MYLTFQEILLAAARRSVCVWRHNISINASTLPATWKHSSQERAIVPLLPLHGGGNLAPLLLHHSSMRWRIPATELNYVPGTKCMPTPLLIARRRTFQCTRRRWYIPGLDVLERPAGSVRGLPLPAQDSAPLFDWHLEYEQYEQHNRKR